jgi:hypothetical protein
MFREGDTIYLPWTGEHEAKIVEDDGRYSLPLKVQTAGETFRAYRDGRTRNTHRLPVLSHTPWTQRAVTERPWEPEDTEDVYVVKDGKVLVGASETHDCHRTYGIAGILKGDLLYLAVVGHNLFPHTPEGLKAARAALAGTPQANPTRQPEPTPEAEPKPFGPHDVTVCCYDEEGTAYVAVEYDSGDGTVLIVSDHNIYIRGWIHSGGTVSERYGETLPKSRFTRHNPTK